MPNHPVDLIGPELNAAAEAFLAANQDTGYPVLTGHGFNDLKKLLKAAIDCYNKFPVSDDQKIASWRERIQSNWPTANVTLRPASNHTEQHLTAEVGEQLVGVAFPSLNRFQIDIKTTDLVDAEVLEMESIPVGASPFDHDGASMASPLVRGWLAMHDGYGRSGDIDALTGLYLHNKHTGQRIRLRFTPKIKVTP